MSMLILIICFLFYIPPVFAEDIYSSDFEYNMMKVEQEFVSSSGITQHTFSMTGENSPSARYNAVREIQKYRNIINNIYRRQKFTYRSYSPTVYQKRRTYDPGKVDWSDPWYSD